MNLATPLLLPPQEIDIDNRKKRKVGKVLKGPYNSMRLENPRKNWKEQKIKFGLHIRNVE